MNLKTIAVLIIICALFTYGLYWFSNEFKEQRIKEYEVIVIDNKEYETNEIDRITRDWLSDEHTIVIIMKDGTKIYAKTYTLKDKEGE